MTFATAVVIQAPKREPKPNALLRRLSRLVDFNEDDLQALRTLTAQARVVSPQTDLIKADEKAGQAVIVLEGFASRYVLLKQGRRQITGYLLPGDVGDLDGLVLGRTTQTVATLSPCTIVQVPAADLLDLLERHPRITRALRLAKLSEEATAREWIVSLGCRPASARIAHLFCELRVRLQAVGLVQDNSYDFPLTQTVIAETLGMSVVHVNRSLQNLRQDGMIALRGKALVIKDLARLQRHAEFSPDYLHIGLS